jgi:hypothetical protein
MKQSPEIHDARISPVADRAIAWLTIVLCVLSIVAAGALGAAVRTGGTGNHFVCGVIDDFGSIVINGVHYDETQANITINGVANQPKSALKLGMIAQINGELDYATNTGTASTVNVDRTLLGQIVSVNASNGEIRVLEQTVTTDANTRFDGIGRASDLQPGEWVSVHGLLDPSKNTIGGTLIERADPTTFISEIRGNATKVRSNKFRIGNLDIIWTGAGDLDQGSFVAVKGAYSAAIGALLATDVTVTSEVSLYEGTDSEIQGYVTDFRSVSSFSVSGVAVDASNAEYSGGTANDIKNGVRIEVEGPIVNGVLIAEEVEFYQSTATHSNTSSTRSVEIEGTVSSFTSLSNFVLKGRQIDASSAKVTIKLKGPLAAGMEGHIKGKLLPDGSIKANTASFVK